MIELAGLDPAEVLIVRHAPVEKALKQVLPWLVVERPDLFLAYQRIQWRTLEKAMTKAKYVASFVGQAAGEATFAGIYRIGDWEELDGEGYRSFPGNAELEALGMSGRTEDMPNCLAFELDALNHYTDWIGKLVIAWPKPHQQWWRWAARGSFMIQQVSANSLFVRGMPRWHDLVLSWRELQALPPAWRSALAQWRGIYFIYDAARGAGYVGAAYGEENILGRWRDYARSGHGGNVALRGSVATDLRFSILQRTSPDLDVADVIALEASWKARLHTREFGFNRN